MTNEETIFAAALTRASTAARAAYLDDACAGNDALRRSVEALLLAHERPAGILESPPAGCDVTAEVPLPSERIGSTVGPYKLLQQIGEGGMAVVFLAEQTRPLKRKVALKVIKPGMDSRQVITRFEAERQALALMDHPNIAKVLEAGTTAVGQPYFVMELVKGVPITNYCDEHHVEPRQRLELFAQVCSAVQHAHTKGIIHRDLKPSNVLVALYDGKPVPKVIDFGIAKATGQQLTERTMFTGFGHVIGTPQYMSPEQAEMNQLDIDTRSDIYSLGVLLYELLTGSTPLESKRLKERALMEVLRVIREEEPPKPSTRLSTTEQLPSIAACRGLEPSKLSVLVRGELDWIVMKALEKDRNRRYETANGLARDVERYLRDEAVQACPPTAGYKLRKLTRKHRVPIAVTAGFALLLIAATVVSSWQALRARRAESLAQVRLEMEKEARTQAVTEAAKATTISDLLQEMLASANPDQARGADYTVRQLLDDSSQRLGDQLNAHPEVEATIRAAIGNAYRRLIMTDQAEPHLRRALAIRRATARVAGDARDAQEALAQSLHDYGWNLLMAERRPEAEAQFREAVVIYKAKGTRSANVIETLATLQLCLSQQQRFADSEAVANEALAMGRELFPEGHREIANVLHRLAEEKQSQRDLVAAEALSRQAVAMHARWHGEKHPETGWGLVVLGKIQMDLGRHTEAQENYRRALNIMRSQFGDPHSVVTNLLTLSQQAMTASGDEAGLAELRGEQTARFVTAIERDSGNLRIRIGLADFLRQSGDVDGALAKFDEAVACATGAAREVRLSLADGCSQLARLLRDKQRRHEAERMFRQAISLREPIDGAPTAVRLAQANDYNDLAFVLRLPEQSSDAEQAVRAGLELNRALVRELPDDLNFRMHLAHSHLGLGHIFASDSTRTADAMQAYREAADILEALAADPAAIKQFPVFLAQTFRQLADAWLNVDLLDDAEQASQKALTIFASLTKEFPDNASYHKELGATHRKLAVSYARRGQWEKAKASLRRCVELSPREHQSLIQWACLCLYTDDQESYRRACQMLVEHFGDTTQPILAERTAKTCSLGPGALDGFDPVLKLADRAVTGTEEDGSFRFFVLAKALVECRAGRHAIALDWVGRFGAKEGGNEYDAIAFSATALAHLGLGQRDEASIALREAQLIIEAKSPDPANGRPYGNDWHDWLHARILFREAEKMLAEPASRP